MVKFAIYAILPRIRFRQTSAKPFRFIVPPLSPMPPQLRSKSVKSDANPSSNTKTTPTSKRKRGSSDGVSAQTSVASEPTESAKRPRKGAKSVASIEPQPQIAVSKPTPADSYCKWVASTGLHKDYHDVEWGAKVMNTDNRYLFEMLILEGAQAGLSWSTILNKREGYRQAFAGFDPTRVAAFTAKDVERLMNDQGIVRNRAKVNSAISNAKLFLELLPSYDGLFIKYNSGEKTKATSELSDKLSADLKKRGFSFVGSTIMYAFLQAVGIVDDQWVF
ncbi:DNA glycosylase [Gonapodya prolifera JEL478]|uniref:DNA glycosylase n=1 Tax=Gonapodya prolifera (strain JEL478) TaxID=1344416 RepID=A0A139B085_GONPJ|nr:DNA glycosylase [Gonapodya prolifera JEL478]|eukprot:KXS22408.1 DNA glycosylase [Gonapodya prolifera JEL478]